jgi:hypothetical protein
MCERFWTLLNAQIDAIGLRVMDGDPISIVGPAVEDAGLNAALSDHSRRQRFANAGIAASRVAA